jgi:hypothetical protein
MKETLMNVDQTKQAMMSIFNFEQQKQKHRPETVARVKRMLEQNPDLKARVEDFRLAEPQLSEYQAITKLWVQDKL